MHTTELDQMRVLQVIGGTDCGGTETWLANVLQRTDRQRVAMDFVVHTHRPGYYDNLIRAQGANILPCLSTQRPWQYARNLRQLLNRAGPYDVVHSHVWYFSGLVLKIAHQQGVPVRIFHSHTTDHSGRSRKNVARRIYTSTMKQWIARHATHRIAASKSAVVDLGDDESGYRSWNVLNCGINLEPFRSNQDRQAVRRELGLADASYVIGHVGRFTAVKNQLYLLRALATLVRRDPSYVLLLVGDGPHVVEVQREAARLGVAGHVRLAGVRSDVARIMSCAMDAFVFPSLYEGLGLALVEAQAAGLRCLASTSVPAAATVVPELVRRRDLTDGPNAWADEIQKMREQTVPIDRQGALRAVASSDFCLTTSVERLHAMYAAALEAKAV